MAESLSHKFGQIIGDILEKTMTIYLQNFADAHGLYLDKKGSRKCRKGPKVTWADGYGNRHDLDYVLERGGSETQIGLPVAFIESAWRRYTKHSKNKAQEIQGAIVPLSDMHSYSCPFLGVILAGEFTNNALNQLTSLNFKVLYFNYNSVVRAFAKFGVDASFDEETTEADFKLKIEQWDKCDCQDKVIDELVSLNEEAVSEFFIALEKSVLRYVTEVRLLSLFGATESFVSAKDALTYLKSYKHEAANVTDFVRFEIRITYNNGDQIEAKFTDKDQAYKFLETYKEPDLQPVDDI